MLRFVDVTESSDKGYSEAAAAAVQKLVNEGHKPHFFVVKEMRGAYRNGNIEFQAVVQVAVE